MRVSYLEDYHMDVLSYGRVYHTMSNDWMD
jgi:hypothetical protein